MKKIKKREREKEVEQMETKEEMIVRKKFDKKRGERK